MLLGYYERIGRIYVCPFSERDKVSQDIVNPRTLNLGSVVSRWNSK